MFQGQTEVSDLVELYSRILHSILWAGLEWGSSHHGSAIHEEEVNGEGPKEGTDPKMGIK